VLAAAIGVDRPVKTDIGAVVAGDDGPRPLDMLDGLERLDFLDLAPAIVEVLARLRLEPPGPVGLRTAAAIGLAVQHPAADQVGIAGLAQLFERLETGGNMHRHRPSPTTAESTGIMRTKLA
jgi:hypothetical protein